MGGGRVREAGSAQRDRRGDENFDLHAAGPAEQGGSCSLLHHVGDKRWRRLASTTRCDAMALCLGLLSFLVTVRLEAAVPQACGLRVLCAQARCVFMREVVLYTLTHMTDSCLGAVCGEC